MLSKKSNTNLFQIHSYLFRILEILHQVCDKNYGFFIFFSFQIEQAAVKREVSFSQIPTSTPQQLEVIGKGGHIPDPFPHHDILEDEVLDEVLILLARLDRERLRLINLCENEQQIRDRLKENIDHWRLKRLHDLPLAVQKGSKKVSFSCL